MSFPALGHRRYTPTGGRRRTARDPNNQPRRYFRAYSYRCFCGLSVKGFYPTTGPDVEPLDADLARCRMVKGAPNFPGTSRAGAKAVFEHDVGCGRTLAQSEADRLGAVAA